MRREIWSDDWPRVGWGDEWREPDGAQLIRFGEWLRDDLARGVTIEQPDDDAYSGLVDWASVRLRINFTK